jgi:hypothetical protein
MQLSAWYAGSGVTALIVLAALAVYGFSTSLGGWATSSFTSDIPPTLPNTASSRPRSSCRIWTRLQRELIKLEFLNFLKYNIN